MNFVLDFFENPNETSETIYNDIKSRIIKNKLQIINVSAYGADNAAVNFGKNKSVFTNLKFENDSIVQANCLCHVLHNCAKQSFFEFPLDFNNLTNKIYDHFSNSAKRISALKEIYDYTENEFQSLTYHTTTRWLSLNRALERTIKNMNEIRSYFIALSKCEIPSVLYDFIWNFDEENRSLSELYIEFAYEFMCIFKFTILLLEKKSTTSLSVHNYMCELRNKIKNRLERKFFGADINEKIKKHHDKNKQIFEKETLKVYKKALDYLDKWYDFNSSIFGKLSCLNLLNKLEYLKVVEIVNYFHLNVNKSQLFDEIEPLYNTFRGYDAATKQLPLDKIYCKVFEENEFPLMQKVIECALSIPVSNAFPERLFSIMKNLMTDERNRLEIDMIKSEICVKTNYSMNCLKFANFIKKDKKLLAAASSSKKYAK